MASVEGCEQQGSIAVASSFLRRHPLSAISPIRFRLDTVCDRRGDSFVVAVGCCEIALAADVRVFKLGAHAVPTRHHRPLRLQEGAGGWTALIWAAKQGQLRTVKTLLAHGADPARTDLTGRTAADWTRDNGHAEVLALLMEEVGTAGN